MSLSSAAVTAQLRRFLSYTRKQTMRYYNHNTNTQRDTVLHIQLNREVHRLHNYNQIQNKEDTIVSTFVLLLLKTEHVSTSYRIIIRRTILS
jgi:hypothetical protein